MIHYPFCAKKNTNAVKQHWYLKLLNEAINSQKDSRIFYLV